MASISSGYTSMLQSRAAECDRSRVLARLQNKGPCSQVVPSTSWPPASSILEQEASLRCNNYFGKKATSSGIHTLSIQNKVGISCSNSSNSNCSKYFRNFPVPCPIETPKNPFVISQSQCQPSRFF